MEFNECARRAVSAMPGLPPDDGHHFLMRVSKDNVAQVGSFFLTHAFLTRWVLLIRETHDMFGVASCFTSAGIVFFSTRVVVRCVHFFFFFSCFVLSVFLKKRGVF